MRVENLSVIDSQQMHIAFTSCLRVTISALTVIAPGSSPNTDGIHISASRGIVVDNSTVSTGPFSYQLIINKTLNIYSILSICFFFFCVCKQEMIVFP